MNYRNRVRRILAGGIVALGLMTSQFSLAAEVVAGVKIDETASVANQELKLNGAGIRYKAIFKVYVAALYLPKKETTVPDVLAAPGPRRIAITMLREVSSEEFGQGFMGGIQKNSEKVEKSKIINQLLKFGELFASIPELKKGDVLVTDWVPGTGTVITLNGKRIIEPLPDIAFYNALLKIWIGEKPVDNKLKKLMLGDKGDDNPRSL